MTDGMGVGKVGGPGWVAGGQLERLSGPEKVEKSFKEVLLESIDRAERLQNDAEVAVSRLNAGQTDRVNEALVAVQKAEVAFQTLIQIRDRIMAAYQEINDMRF